jgi:hypothetical protein
MIRKETGELVCDACGHPATHHNPDGGASPHACETCLAIEHGDREGSRFVLAEAFIVQANMALGWGLTVHDLHRCVDEAQKMIDDDERVTADVPWLESLSGDRRSGRPWLRRLQPIETGGGGS